MENSVGESSWLLTARLKLESLAKRLQRQLLWEATDRWQVAAGETRRRLGAVIDILCFRLGEERGVDVTKKRVGLLWQLHFGNQGFEHLGLEGLLRRKEVVALVPESFKDLSPTVVFDYTHQIRKRILNYKAALDETVNQDLSEIHCECDQHKQWANKDLDNHICTGDLGLVKDAKLRLLLQKGPKYRERRPLDWEEVKSEVESTVDGVVEKWARSEAVEPVQLAAWKDEVLKRVDDKLERLQRDVPFDPGNEYLDTPEGKKALSELLSRFVLVSADKSENNVVIVCKRHYVKKLRDELAVKPDQTYLRDESKVTDVILMQMEKVKAFGVKFGINVTKEQEKLATLYWTAKMHKDPTAERFIASSSKCVTKILSQLLSKCLKAVQEQLSRECHRERVDSKQPWSKYWIVGSSDEVIKKIQAVNRKRKASSVGSFDFSTLYTKLKHESLKEKLKWAIEKAFASSGKPKLAIYSTSARFVEEEREGTVVITASELVELVEFLVDNLVIVYGDRVYRQVVGIPMGTDCAPFLANLYLFVLEYEWVTTLAATEEGREKLSELELICRYIDDLFTVNGESVLAASLLELYPGLVVKPEHREQNRTHFLDLMPVVNNGRIVLSTYDKRDAFPFEVRSFPDLSGNVHVKKAHGLIRGQLKRFAQACDQWPAFTHRMHSLTDRLLRQGFVRDRLELEIGRFFVRRGGLVSKYSRPKQTFIDGCFSPRGEKRGREEVEKEKEKKEKRKRQQLKRRLKRSKEQRE